MSDESGARGVSVCREEILEFGSACGRDMRASDDGDAETRAYVSPMRWRHVTRVSCRNVRWRARGTARRDDDDFDDEGVDDDDDDDDARRRRSTMDASGTYFTLRAHRAKGAVYAPTPYGEVCVDDDGANFSPADENDDDVDVARFRSELARDGRGLNPDWSATEGGTWRGGREGREAAASATKFELCVFATTTRRRRAGRKTTKEARAETVEETRGDATTTATRRWRRGVGERASATSRAAAEVAVADELVCRAAIDLTRLRCVGDRVPSGAEMPANALFLHASDGGVYAPEPSSTDNSGREVLAFLDAVEARRREAAEARRIVPGARPATRPRARTLSFGGRSATESETEDRSSGVLVIDRVVVEDDDAPSRASESPRFSSLQGREKRGAAVKTDVRAMISKIESVIEAKRAHADAVDLRDELARRLKIRAAAVRGTTRATMKTLTSSDGVTADERITALTNELVEERDILVRMKDDVGRRVRALRQAGEKLVRAHDRLDEAERALRGPNGAGKLHQHQRALVARRWRLVGDLASIFPIEPVDDADADADAPTRRDYPLLRVGELPLDLGPAPSKTYPLRMETMENDAAALGDVAQMCVQLAAILDVRLRYPVCVCPSRSYICDFHHVKPTRGRGDDGASAKKLTKVEFPLFLEHPADRTKYTYGVFLLNKNLEQLLNAHGLRSAGPRHTLQNLRRILNARCVVASAREEEDAHA